MHYYQFNIGDYKSHTEHLSEMEDLTYRRLLDWYYLHEAPIPTDINEVARQIRMRSHCECIATVLQEYFASTADGWIHHRADRELEKLGDKSRKAKQSAKVRWDKEKHANALRTHCEGNATHNTLHITQDTTLVSKDTLSPEHPATIPNCPHSELIDLFAKRLPELPQPKPELWTSARAKAMCQRWKWVLTAKKKSGDRYATTKDDALAWFDRFFAYAAQSDFLSGRDGRWTSCDLGWLMKAENFAKVVQGNYENKKAA